MGAQRKMRGGGKNRLQNWDETEFEAYADWESMPHAVYDGAAHGNSQSSMARALDPRRSAPRSAVLRGEARSSMGSSSGSMQGGRGW
jgi:hypothetical protein